MAGERRSRLWWLIVSGWLAFQAVSPEILQHVQAGLRAKEEGRLNAAIAELQRVAQLDPTSAVAFMNLGAVYVQKREYGNAIQVSVALSEGAKMAAPDGATAPFVGGSERARR